MFLRRGALLICCISGFCLGQTVTFHSPIPWITLRENLIIAKTLIDTAEVKNNEVVLTLSKVVDGRKAQVVSKKFKTSDYSYECDLGAIKDEMIGGKNYYRIDWKVLGAAKKSEEKKGAIFPVGVIKLIGENKESTLLCKKTEVPLTAEAATGALKDEDFAKAGNCMICAQWNEKSLGLILKNYTGAQTITVYIDGKNGKNAFLSYSDRVITYSPANDSISAVYYKRTIIEEGIKYEEKKWVQQIEKNTKDGLTVIIIPWSDLGMLITEGRIFGIGVFAYYSEKEKAAFPLGAEQEIPGTWGNAVLSK